MVVVELVCLVIFFDPNWCTESLWIKVGENIAAIYIWSALLATLDKLGLELELRFKFCHNGCTSFMAVKHRDLR